ncbi:hypothetical protein C2845_PM17G02990 [Panicum miliaceum]|uniref:F-box domain-containing protein n=1 Tax=Panicum miliaceum TaxID=4540 RepID=A0A3L6PZN7_PANMI|nr:hypothetical protein C2845_PM17G02990 [Panicum miliaceum]
MAALTRRWKKALAAMAPAPAIDPADHLSKIPDEVLAQILSFLPAQEAVQTCVLARTWRDVWKTTEHLLITGNTVLELREFVDGLLRVRLDNLKRAPLDACKIMFDPIKVDDDDYFDLEDTSSVNSWIRHVLKCQVKVLRVDMGNHMDLELYLYMSESPLVSRHLTRLELRGIYGCAATTSTSQDVLRWKI